MKNIIELISDSVLAYPKPAVYISGGLDSCILLHHLVEKTNERVFTYTATFDLDGDETNWAKMVAEHYGTKHHTIDCSTFLDDLVEIMRGFTHPRYNVWAYYLAKEAKKDKRTNIYLGEGADEHFGGYSDKPYLEAWADQFTFVRSTFQEMHDSLGLNVHFPFSNIDWRKTLPYYSPPNKFHLTLAYRAIIPSFIMESRNKIKPSFTNYWQLWYKFLKPKHTNYHPECLEDIRKLLRYLAVSAWLEANETDFVG